MAQVHINQNARYKWMAVVVIAGIAIAAAWRLSSQHPAASSSDASQASAPLEAASSAQVIAMPPLEGSSKAIADKAMSDQVEVAKEVERQPVIPPIKGLVKARPSFLSQMEWDMVQGVANQQPHPDQALTHLVNSVRFNKQLELWQSLSKSADLAKRQTLAKQLLEDIPQRVIDQDMEEPEAKKLQESLLPDVSGDQAMAAQEAKRLADALKVRDAAASK